ncbi:MAG: hypothetical protein J6O55_07450 [Lachnospiraceae bacterium]|nr:hypothetical protein [Lachnospiraceae bacterium]
MLHVDDANILNMLTEGKIGLEMENLRVTESGYMAQTKHPFPQDDPYIIRDFCENQTEINTAPLPTPEAALDFLSSQVERIKEKLSNMPEREYLWPFSNPPFIRNEEDIPIAVFYGEMEEKTRYREYLGRRYGRYKMAFSGIHFNYSFSEELLQAEFAHSHYSDFRQFKDDFYIKLAAWMQQYNWLVVAATAASPILDSSFFEKEVFGHDVFNGMASSRCSEIGYWNFFTPIFDYRDLSSYVKSIEHYLDSGLILTSSELYYPVRLKPKGAYSLDSLKKTGADHIELRMIDLNPLSEVGLCIEDVRFMQLLLIYLASKGDIDMDADHQVQAIANTKNAARYDLKTVNLIMKVDCTISIADAAKKVIEDMQDFFRDKIPEAEATLSFQHEKFVDMEKRYAIEVRKRFSGGFVAKGMSWVKNGKKHKE